MPFVTILEKTGNNVCIFGEAKRNNMTTKKIHIRGTEINKIDFWDIEEILQDKGLDVNSAYELMADDKENIYVSNGFIAGLNREENEDGEWHHFFKKQEDGSFEAGKFYF